MASDLESCIERAAEAIPDGLPGLDELPNWSVTLRTAARTVGHLRQTIREQPPHIFVERLRTLWLNEATASARFLGRFRRSRLERFYGELETSLAAADGSLTPVARMLRRAVEEGREPAGSNRPRRRGRRGARDDDPRCQGSRFRARLSLPDTEGRSEGARWVDGGAQVRGQRFGVPSLRLAHPGFWCRRTTTGGARSGREGPAALRGHDQGQEPAGNFGPLEIRRRS